MFNREGDCPAVKLRPGNVHSADATFAKPEIYEALDGRGVNYAIRIPANENLELDIAELLSRPVGRPSIKPWSSTRVSLISAGCKIDQ